MTRKRNTGPGTISTTVPKPVFSYFTVFRGISAPEARKMPDLSGRQIRQLFCVYVTLKMQPAKKPNRSPTQYPQGARRIRKAAKPPTAAQWVRFGSKKQARPAKKPRRKAGIRAIRACLELSVLYSKDIEMIKFWGGRRRQRTGPPGASFHRAGSRCTSSPGRGIHRPESRCRHGEWYRRPCRT